MHHYDAFYCYFRKAKSMGKFKLFSYNPPKKGVSKQDERASVQTDFVGFFYMLGRKFWNISNLNLIVGLYIVFVAAGIWLLSGIPWAFYTFFAIAVILFGLISSASTYIIRGYVRGDPVYILSDFKYALKQNWKQGIILGIIDFLVIFLLIFDIFFWMGPIELPALPVTVTEEGFNQVIYDGTDDYSVLENTPSSVAGEETSADPTTSIDTAANEADEAPQSFLRSVSFYGCIFLLIIYFMMRNYIYIILVTFKLSLFKVLKNSFIFAFVGLKRNIMAFIGIILVCFINYTVFIYLPIVGAVLPLIITPCICSFIGAYASYPVIKKYMITPFYNDEEVSESYDRIFTDRD